MDGVKELFGVSLQVGDRARSCIEFYRLTARVRRGRLPLSPTGAGKSGLPGHGQPVGH